MDTGTALGLGPGAVFRKDPWQGEEGGAEMGRAGKGREGDGEAVDKAGGV